MTRKVKQPGRGYAGREKTTLFLYDKDGKYIRKYESQAEFRKDYFPNDSINSKRPIIDKKRGGRANYGYALNYDNTFIANYRIGRENLRKYEAIVNCPFCQHQYKDKTIIAYNMLNKEVARFKNLNTATKLTNIDSTTIHRQCNSSTNKIVNTKTGLRFRYE